MARRRYKDTGRGTFMGDYLYAGYLERHRDHFLVALHELFDWEGYSERLIGCYRVYWTPKTGHNLDVSNS